MHKNLTFNKANLNRNPIDINEIKETIQINLHTNFTFEKNPFWFMYINPTLLVHTILLKSKIYTIYNIKALHLCIIYVCTANNAIAYNNLHSNILARKLKNKSGKTVYM